MHNPPLLRRVPLEKGDTLDFVSPFLREMSAGQRDNVVDFKKFRQPHF